MSYKDFVGPVGRWDLIAGHAFSVMFSRGLRGSDRVLDIGCGGLRVGRLLIAFLEPGCYYGFDPETWVLREGLENEIGTEFAVLKDVHCAEGQKTIPKLWMSLRFKFVLAQSIFTHAPIDIIQDYIKKVSAILETGGTFLFTFLPGAENYGGDKWIYPGNVQYTREFIEKMVFSGGLLVEESSDMEKLHPGKHHWMICRKR